MPCLSHLTVKAVWPLDSPLHPGTPHLDLARYPVLVSLNVCGSAPPQFLNIFTGRSTSLRRFVTTESVDFGNEATNFFSRFSDCVSAMIVAGGYFSEPVTCRFLNLRSLKLAGGLDLLELGTLDCPNLVQLSLCQEGFYSLIGNTFLTTLVTQCSRTLIALHLRLPRSAAILTLKKSTINALSCCEGLQTLGIDGPIRLTQDNLRVFGRTHPELEAVMITYDDITDADLDKMQVRSRNHAGPLLSILTDV
jgi:hypothetical protein